MINVSMSPDLSDDFKTVTDNSTLKSDEIIAQSALNTTDENNATAAQTTALIAELELLKARVDAPSALPKFSRYEVVVALNGGGEVLPSNTSRRKATVKFSSVASTTTLSNGYVIKANEDLTFEWDTQQELKNTSIGGGSRTFEVWETYD